MMDPSPVSKFAATSTDISWAQAYSAGKLNIVLSLQGDIEGVQIASLGKETLEKLQREFFAIDQKTLENIKKIVEEAAKTVPLEISLSLVLSTIVEDILYIVAADAGYAIVKRLDKISVVAEGKKGEILSFSGKTAPNDTVLMGTKDLFETIPLKDIGVSMHLKTSDDIAENLAPFLHEKAKGTEAGIAWKIPGNTAQMENYQKEVVHEETSPLGESGDKVKGESLQKKIFQILKSISIPIKINTKQIIVAVTVLLILFLAGSILMEQTNRKQKAELKMAENLIEENKQKYEDALTLFSINKSLAVDDLTDVKKVVEEEAGRFSPDTPADKKIQSFLNDINKALNGKGGNSKIGLFYDASKNNVLKQVLSVTTKGDTISAGGKSKGGFLSSGGNIDETFDYKGSASGITADEKNIFVLSENNVIQIPRNSLKSKSIFESDNNPVSIDTFGGNVYLLSKDDKTIYRYRPNNFSEEAYLPESLILSDPVSMAIDASIYVIDGGKIRKFTRGDEDSFSEKNGTSFSKSSKIFTDIDYANLYVLDSVKKKAYVIDKKGNKVNEFSLKGLKNITGIAANEKDKKIYVVADGNIYSISF